MKDEAEIDDELMDELLETLMGHEEKSLFPDKGTEGHVIEIHIHPGGKVSKPMIEEKDEAEKEEGMLPKLK